MQQAAEEEELDLDTVKMFLEGLETSMAQEESQILLKAVASKEFMALIPNQKDLLFELLCFLAGCATREQPDAKSNVRLLPEERNSS